MHYTEEPPRLFTTPGAAYAHVHGSGFVTREMLDHTIDELRRATRDGLVRHGAVLVDLRAVVGYESACLLTARQFLREAASLGLQRIALVATSSVMHTAMRLAAHSATIELRTFHHDVAAIQWLHPVVVPRPRTASSEAMAAP